MQWMPENFLGTSMSHFLVFENAFFFCFLVILN